MRKKLGSFEELSLPIERELFCIVTASIDSLDRCDEKNLNSRDRYHETQPWEFYFVQLMI